MLEVITKGVALSFDFHTTIVINIILPAIPTYTEINAKKNNK